MALVTTRDRRAMGEEIWIKNKRMRALTNDSVDHRHTNSNTFHECVFFSVGRRTFALRY